MAAKGGLHVKLVKTNLFQFKRSTNNGPVCPSPHFEPRYGVLSATAPVAALAPFRVRSFRFQWPADLATSWAFEMETLILGWYVLVETQSVFMLTVFASLLYIGTLLAPMFGVMGDRIGHRNVLCAMRTVYATLATILMVLAFTGLVTPGYVLISATVFGLVRPSDIGMRTAVVGDIVPATQLMGAMSIQRTTQDSARIAGALTGAGVVATLGMGPAYFVVASLYVASVLLTLKAGGARTMPHPAPDAAPVPARASPWHELRAGLAYVWTTPHLLAMMCLAFLLNLTAFPLFNSLLPYVAKEIYHADQTVLGYMVAGAASGAVATSLALSRYGSVVHPARMMIIACLVWYSLLFVFGHTPHPAGGITVLILAGCMQSLSQVPMATMLLRNSDVRFRGRIMGIRMLAIYGNLPGLLISGPLIAHFGFPVTATLYCAIGLGFTLLIAVRWRAHLWRLDAPVNVR
ncbi:MAG: MFS transporter [Betaproteobacteria bacterium]|nr:MFS transporter [Betaproteobacteria bacterium]